MKALWNLNCGKTKPVHVVTCASSRREDSRYPLSIAGELEFHISPLGISFVSEMFLEGETMSTREFYPRFLADPLAAPHTSRSCRREFDGSSSELPEENVIPVSAPALSLLGAAFQMVRGEAQALGGDGPIFVTDRWGLAMRPEGAAFAVACAAKKGVTRKSACRTSEARVLEAIAGLTGHGTL